MGSAKKKKAAAAPKRPQGRPSKFSDLLAMRIIDLVEKGHSIEKIAELTGIGERTLFYWLSSDKKAEFRHLVDGARRIADDLVEAALFRRAVGYTHPEIKYFAHEGVVSDERVIEKHEPPSVEAATFWLKNRRPKRWKQSVPEQAEHAENRDITYETEWGGTGEPTDGNASGSKKDS